MGGTTNRAGAFANLHRRTRCWTGRAGVAAGLLLAGLGAPVLAQLSSADIAALRKRGEREGWTFTVGESAATRRPMHELCGAVEPPDWEHTGRVDRSPLVRGLPQAYDWREHNGCTPIRDQDGCGSCWAFSAVGAMESTILLNEGASEDLSEQWLVSCTWAGSCSGGWHTSALEFFRCDGARDPCGDCGAVLEADFPYQAADVPCYNCPGAGYPHPYYLVSWTRLSTGVATPAQIKQAIYTHGPVSTTVYVNSAFHAYTGGVFNDCESAQVNHAVVLVGWDDTQGASGVWILRNSWDTDWGEDGYMRIEYGCSRVGYATCYVNYSTRDCNNNDVPDECDVSAGTSPDCNGNETPDECDVSAGTSRDCTSNGVPDECETDCNRNGIRDDCDIAAGTSHDCTANGVPDECEVDCNSNGVRDDCDVAAGTSPDCNANSIPDQCDFWVCESPWNGFEDCPPFCWGTPMDGLDSDADGISWENPSESGFIDDFGCPEYSQAVQVNVFEPAPVDGYVTSEYFRPLGGALGCEAAVYALSFAPNIDATDSYWDWVFLLRDALSGGLVAQIEFASTESRRSGLVAGHIMVKDPAGGYVDTGVGLTTGECFDLEATLNNPLGEVQLYVNGDPVLATPLPPWDADACRLDYFRLYAVENYALASHDPSDYSIFNLDAFELCRAGHAEALPEVYDCNSNGVLDECDITDGVSVDCDGDGVPDGCRIYGDADRDGDVDSADYHDFQACVTAPDHMPDATCVDLDFDFDCDDDIDLVDFGAFQRAFTGSP